MPSSFNQDSELAEFFTDVEHLRDAFRQKAARRDTAWRLTPSRARSTSGIPVEESVRETPRPAPAPVRRGSRHPSMAPLGHYILADVYSRQGRLAEARSQQRAGDRLARTGAPASARR